MKKYFLPIMIFCSMILLSLGVGIFSFNYQVNFASASAQEEEVFQDEAPQNLKELQDASDGQLDHWATKLDKFDGREYDYITPVRNQYSKNTCWAFAAVGAAEASILRNGIDQDETNQTLDLDETITAYNRHVRDGSQDPLLLTTNDTYNYGNWNQGDSGAASAFSIMTQGYTLLDENNFNTSVDVNKIKSALQQSKYYVKSYQSISSDKNSIKRAILQYGAVAFNYAGPSEIKFYSPNAQSNHTSIIVGWDDTIEISEFKPKKPSSGGAWIIKNSWGKYMGDEGYFYISYEQPIGGLYSIDVAMQKDYQNIYHYDGNVTVNMAKKAGDAQAAIYEAKLSSPTKQEQLKAVMIYVPEDNLDVNVKIYKNLTVNPGNVNDKINNPEQGDPALSMNTKIMRNGMHTIDLQEPINLEQGEYFSIVIRCTGNNGASVSVKCAVDYNNSINDMTYYLENNQWISFKSSNYYADSSTGNKTAKIRAITNTVERTTEPSNDLKFARVEIVNRLVYYAQGEQLVPEVQVYLDGDLLENGQDYLVEALNITAPGKTAIKIVGTGNYQGTRTTYFEVAKAKDPPGRINETIVVYNDKTNLSDIPTPTDWQWANENQKLEIGTNVASLIYVGKDKDFYQNTTYSVNVNKINEKPPADIDISSAVVEIIDNCVYTGEPIVPEVKVLYDSTELHFGIDYTLTFENNTNAGNATIIVEGNGRYFGEVRQTFEIQKAEWPKEMPNRTFIVSYRIKNLNQISLNCNNWAWETPNFDIESNNFKTTAIYTGLDANNYINTQMQITIIREPQLEISSLTELALDTTSFVYDGHEKTPNVIARDGVFILAKGTDYEVEYKNNTNAGQASVIVKGINAYTGTKELFFTISQAKQPKVETTLKLHNHFEDLSEIELPNDFEWVEDSLQIISETKMIAKAIYKGSDANSYETTELTFEIIIEEEQQNLLDNQRQESLIWLAIVVPAAALLVGWIVFAIVRHRKKQWWK